MKTDSFGNELPKTMFVNEISELGKALLVNTFRLAVDQDMALGHTVKYNKSTKTASILDKNTGLYTFISH